jgi:hypothetical protein
MTDENRPILSVHRADFPDAEWTFFDTWVWGWVGVENGQAVAVLTATHSKNYGDLDAADEWATVQYIYSRGHGFAPEIITHAKRELDKLPFPIALCRSGTATPEGEAVCAELELDPNAQYKVSRYKTKLGDYRFKLTQYEKQLRRLAPGQVAPPAPSEPEYPLQSLSRAKARADGHKILLAASGLLGIDAIEPKPEICEDESQATNLT